MNNEMVLVLAALIVLVALQTLMLIAILLTKKDLNRFHNETMLGMKSIGDMVHDHVHGVTNYLAEIASCVRRSEDNNKPMKDGHDKHRHTQSGRQGHHHGPVVGNQGGHKGHSH